MSKHKYRQVFVEVTSSILLSSWLEYDVHQGWSVMVIDGYHWSSMVIDSQQVGRRSNDWPAYCQRRRRIRRCRRPKKSGEIATDGQEDHLDMYKINRQKKWTKYPQNIACHSFRSCSADTVCSDGLSLIKCWRKRKCWTTVLGTQLWQESMSLQDTHQFVDWWGTCVLF